MNPYSLYKRKSSKRAAIGVPFSNLKIMPLSHQTLKFRDLPVNTQFYHPKTNKVCTKIFPHKYYNAHHGPSFILIHPETTVTLTTSIDFYSLDYSAKFAYEQTAYIKIGRNRAKALNDSEITKYFEPSDSVSPL